MWEMQKQTLSSVTGILYLVSWDAIGSQSLLEIKAARDSCPRVGRSAYPSSSFFMFFCPCQAGIHLSASKTGII